jgi:hypothetical protein
LTVPGSPAPPHAVSVNANTRRTAIASCFI